MLATCGRSSLLLLLVACVGAAPASALIPIYDQSSIFVLGHLNDTRPDHWTFDSNGGSYFFGGDYLRGSNNSREYGVWLTDPGNLTPSTYFDSNPQVDPRIDTLRLVGGSIDSIHVERTYVLRGTPVGQGRSDLVEHVLLSNVSSVPAVAHYFHWMMMSAHTMPDSLSAPTAASIQITGDRWSLTETVSGVLPSVIRLGAGTENFGLEDESSTMLTPATDLVVAQGVQWCFQWDIPLAPGQSVTFDIGATYQLVPSPGTLAALGGMVVLIGRRARRA